MADLESVPGTPRRLTPAIAGGTDGDDPIFKAIEACRVAKEASDHAYARKDWLLAIARKKFGAAQTEAINAFIGEALGCEQDDYSDGPAAALWNSYEAFAETVPTTLAGLFAMLVFAGESRTMHSTTWMFFRRSRPQPSCCSRSHRPVTTTVRVLRPVRPAHLMASPANGQSAARPISG